MAYQTSVVSSTEEALSVGFGLGLHCRRRQESVHAQAQAVPLSSSRRLHSCRPSWCRILAIESLGNTLEVGLNDAMASSSILPITIPARLGWNTLHDPRYKSLLQRCGFSGTSLEGITPGASPSWITIGRYCSDADRLLESTSCRFDRASQLLPLLVSCFLA